MLSKALYSKLSMNDTTWNLNPTKSIQLKEQFFQQNSTVMCNNIAWKRALSREKILATRRACPQAKKKQDGLILYLKVIQKDFLVSLKGNISLIGSKIESKDETICKDRDQPRPQVELYFSKWKTGAASLNIVYGKALGTRLGPGFQFKTN